VSRIIAMDISQLLSYFHWYGFLIGLGAVVALELSERKARAEGVTPACWRRVTLWVLVLGVFGARLWHVITDFYLYQDNMLAAVYMWEGGLSIIGAVAGGLVGIWGALRSSTCSSLHFARIADLLVFGLPFGQAIGRWGNWVNQELYGVPTDLPWAISIDPERRAAEYSEFSYFHPLFLYESVLLAGFGVWIWWWSSRFSSSDLQRMSSKWKIGTGWFMASYLGFYSATRFFLEYLRVEKAPSWIPGLSVNQVVAAVVLVGVVYWLYIQQKSTQVVASKQVKQK